MSIQVTQVRSVRQTLMSVHHLPATTTLPALIKSMATLVPVPFVSLQSMATLVPVPVGGWGGGGG